MSHRPATTAAARFVRQQQVLAEFAPFSAATLWRKVKSGEFPRPIKLSERVTAWRMEDLQQWMQTRGA